MTTRQLKKWRKARRRRHAIETAANIARRNTPRIPKETRAMNRLNRAAKTQRSLIARIMDALRRQRHIVALVLFCLWLSGCTPYGL